MAGETDTRLLLLWAQDNILVATSNISEGTNVLVDGETVRLPQSLALGHKIARMAIGPGATIYKYGAPIGRATQPIAMGEHVHVHNVVSNYTRSHSADETLPASSP